MIKKLLHRSAVVLTACGIALTGGSYIMAANMFTSTNDTTGTSSNNDNVFGVSNTSSAAIVRIASESTSVSGTFDTGNDTVTDNTTVGGYSSGDVDVDGSITSDLNGSSGPVLMTPLNNDVTANFGNDTTGASSDNTNTLSVSNSNTVSVSNSASASNSLGVAVDTGNNTITNNTTVGNVTGGDASLGFNFSTTENQSNSLPLMLTGSASTTATSSNDTTGSGSTNSNTVSVSNSNSTSLSNSATVSNSASLTFNSGNNTLDSNTTVGNVSTGNVSANLSVSNTLN